ncbi:amidase [Novosphingobium taihuense]|uniref:Aspartyl-tRNA(Asn)/glutamyl-tRNA(Gln) amidotransferase subunit A n=1 Tax=Novosphingobium taihuense TaxID=260085 RepID=A0A7W7AEG6_9SPHN|nr:amidase [Novosphingobium taihuense]MBB4614849.1 aspartyl-tRNA(Asn)/glutamyl-tRNA(Gln) amidotransferase subunit A [Novosphingobium taihuense]TWH84709.1 aspartyl-tRNA(Asn)/glutamyl-tRNA(Gln) amidotransferase subunit A [Novosphingobium taihuense]
MIDRARLEAVNAKVHAFVEFDEGARYGEGPLDDLTLGVKANVAVRGLKWTGGMGHRREVRAGADAPVVAALRAAGMAVLGTLNMHEAALGATTDNAFYGRTLNPHRDGCTPGGSSGGSGAAAAAGLCDVALGTDTLGSIRIPAAYCGAYGLKPTHGAVPDEGLLFLRPEWDVIGPLAMDLGKLERVWRVMSPGSSTDTRPFERLLVLDGLCGVQCQSGVLAGYDRARAAIGLPLQGLQLPGALTALRVSALTLAVEYLRLTMRESLDAASAELRSVMTAVEKHQPDQELLQSMAAMLHRALGEDAVLLTPTTPHAAFLHGTRPPASQADFTAPASVAGLPALAVPAGRDADGLPVSVQLVGPRGSEMRLIALARRIEPALGGAIFPSS